METIITETRQKIAGALEALSVDLATVRTGRANPALIENLQIEVYGSRMPLKQLGVIAVPDPRLLTVQVWDPSCVAAIEKGILQANVGLNPNTDGTLIRLPVPPLSQERREQLIKLVSQKLELSRIQIRQVRQDAIKSIDQTVSSEDERQRLEKQVQQEVDKTMDAVAVAGQRKEEELRQV